MSHTSFDATAADFERFRAFPPHVAPAIRDALWSELRLGPDARVLDLGAGTGRIGAAFVAGGDAYVGLDPSAAMLAQFTAKLRECDELRPCLVQGDGRALPFPGATFDVVLLAHVVSGVRGWECLLVEARRVLRPGGALVLARSAAPADGVDKRMRARLDAILDRAGVDMRKPGAAREDVLDWIGREANRTAEVIAASWESSRSPRDFLSRHATGARFVMLPQPVRDEALRQLADWAAATFGTLDAVSVETHALVLDIAVY